MHLPGSFVLVGGLAADPGLEAQLTVAAAVWGGGGTVEKCTTLTHQTRVFTMRFRDERRDWLQAAFLQNAGTKGHGKACGTTAALFCGSKAKSSIRGTKEGRLLLKRLHVGLVNHATPSHVTFLGQNMFSPSVFSRQIWPAKMLLQRLASSTIRIYFC